MGRRIWLHKVSIYKLTVCSALLGAGALLAPAGFAQTAPPIFICVDRKGSVEVVPSPNCSSKLTLYALQGAKGSVVPPGPPGPQGPAGPAGPQGPAGPEGPAGSQGPQGPTGPTGPTGPAGAQGKTGPTGPGFVFRDAWTNTTQYALNDVVTENGSSWVAVQANQNVNPSTDGGTNWQLMAAKGDVGPTGPQGPAGTTGPAGDTGPVGPTGPQGPPGDVGATGPQGPVGNTGPAGPAGPPGPAGPTDGWLLSGNAGTTAGDNFLGTTDDQPLEIKVNGTQVMRFEPEVTGGGPNLIGGNSCVTPGVQGATIGGGGSGPTPDNCSGLVRNPTYNAIRGNFATIGGGEGNFSNDLGGTVAGGISNITRDNWSTVGGGTHNYAGSISVVTLGTGFGSTVAGGESNTASGQDSALGGGNSNTASGIASTVAGGKGNTASGDYSFAGGVAGNVSHTGSFLWAGATFGHDGVTPIPFNSVADNEFAVRALGGVRFLSSQPGGGETGVILSSGSGSWASLSDRAAKSNFASVDTRELVKRVSELPILTWNYKAQHTSIRHIGPMAQDFHAAFKVGEDDRHITAVDADGVALAAIQGLYKMLQDKDAQIAAQRVQTQALLERQQAEIRRLRAEQATLAGQVAQIGVLKARLDSLERSSALRKVSTW